MFLKVSLSTLMSYTWFSFLTMVRESFPFLFVSAETLLIENQEIFLYILGQL